MKKIYCISGLGSDEKIFVRIKVDGYQLVYIAWLPPERNEPIEVYAKRMSESITEENPLLMGLSFGGMMAIEIAKIVPVEKLILLSSVKSRKELPLWMRFCGTFRLNKTMPMRPYRFLEPLENYNMGVTNEEEKQMVARYRKSVDPDYLTWAINAVVNWKNTWQPQHLFHIHGDADRIFPIRNMKADYIVKGGGHFMVYNKASEINAFLQKILRS